MKRFTSCFQNHTFVKSVQMEHNKDKAFDFYTTKSCNILFELCRRINTVIYTRAVRERFVLHLINNTCYTIVLVFSTKCTYGTQK